MQYLLQILYLSCQVQRLPGCFPQKQNGWMLRFCFWGWIMWKMCNKTIIEFGFRMISWIIKTSCLCYLPKPKAEVDNTDLGFDNSWYHAQPYPIIVYYIRLGITCITNYKFKRHNNCQIKLIRNPYKKLRSYETPANA